MNTNDMLDFATSEKLAAISAMENKNLLTLAEKTDEFQAAINLTDKPETIEPIVSHPLPEFGGVSVGDDYKTYLLAQAEKIASKIKLVSDVKSDDKRVLTLSTVTFDHECFNGNKIPVSVRFREYTLYKDGRTSVTDSIYVGKGFVRQDCVEKPYVDTHTSLFRWAYKTVINAHMRLENARRVVKNQAEQNMKLVGHDETKRASVSEFLKLFAKVKVKGENKGMPDAELAAKAQAQYERFMAQTANE